VPSARSRPARTGRRPGPTDTRGEILRVARETFAQTGYGASSLRGIARTAGVDPALIVHFFGSKAGLFIASIGWPFSPDEAHAVVAEGPRHIGENLAAMFMRHWDDERERSPILAMLHVATGEPAGAQMMREFLVQYMLEPLVETIGGEDAGVRAGLIASQLIGLGLTRYVLRYEPLASAPSSFVTEILAASIQRVIDEPLP
jgi:AcrR family transcriptional regulator